jgi:hypothetical protein
MTQLNRFTDLINGLHDILGGELGAFILIGGSAPLGLAVEQGLAVLVEPKLGYDHLGGVDAHIDGGSVDLLAGDPLDVDDPLAAVHLDDLALATLVGSSHHLDLVVLAHGHRPHVVLAAQIAGERRTHQHAANARRRCEVRLPILPPGARHSRVVLHLRSLPVSFSVSEETARQNGGIR